MINKKLNLNLKINELREAQRKDAACISINKQLANRKLGKRNMIIPERLLLNCKIINGIVFVVRRNKRTAVNDTLIVPYIPDTLMSEALKMAHTELLAGHHSVRPEAGGHHGQQPGPGPDIQHVHPLPRLPLESDGRLEALVVQPVPLRVVEHVREGRPGQLLVVIVITWHHLPRVLPCDQG